MRVLHAAVGRSFPAVFHGWRSTVKGAAPFPVIIDTHRTKPGFFFRERGRGRGAAGSVARVRQFSEEGRSQIPQDPAHVRRPSARASATPRLERLYEQLLRGSGRASIRGVERVAATEQAPDAEACGGGGSSCMQLRNEELSVGPPPAPTVRCGSPRSGDKPRLDAARLSLRIRTAFSGG